MDHNQYIAIYLKSDEAAKIALFNQVKDLENEDRRCFSQTRDGWEVAGREDLSQHPHKSLIPLYNTADGRANADAFVIDAPIIDDANPAKRVFALAKKERQELTGQLSIVPTFSEFRATFLDIFCEGLFKYMNWDNVFAAGGGVLASAQPVPLEHATSSTTKRKYFHELQYSSSDVDLFLYGLDEEGAKKKLVEIYGSVCKSCPHTVVCFRSAHAVTLVSRYPFRHIQIVLRLYSSPYEVLAGFDVDACTVGFDGKNVYADVRAHHALVTRKNTIDVTRRSPSYEMRLAKYGVRGFEVEVKDLKRDLVDPGIFERPWASLEGFAKLLVLEKLRTPEQRMRFFEMQKLNRSGGVPNEPRRRHQQDVEDAGTRERMEEKLGGTAEASNYSTVFLPWGELHSAESTMRLMAKKDLVLNARWFMKDRTYRLHPCFFGTAEEILNDCSEDDPPFPPKRDNEDATIREHRETYVRGPLQFIVDDPGRQRIGSFHPLSEEGWAEGVHFHELTEELFAATNANDPERIKKALQAAPSIDVRDFFGRTPLHLALMSGATKAARTLLEEGASPLEPMAGGRTVFHLVAMYGRVELLNDLHDAAKKMLLKKEQAALASVTEGNTDEESIKRARASVKQLLRARDGDSRLSALQMALIFGRLDCARALIKAGAVLYSENLPGKDSDGNDLTSPMELVSLLPDDCLEEGIKFLLENGLSCARILPGAATKRWNQREHLINELIALVSKEDERAIEILSRLDPDFKKACYMVTPLLEFPLLQAVKIGNPVIVEILLKAGSPVEVTMPMVEDARQIFEESYPLKNFTGGIPVIMVAIPKLATSILELLDLWNSAAESVQYRRANPSRSRQKMSDLMEGDPMFANIVLRNNAKNLLQVVQDAWKMVELLLPHYDLNQTNVKFWDDTSLRIDGDVRPYDIDDEFWVKFRGFVPKNGFLFSSLALSVKEYAGWFVGKLLKEIQGFETEPFLEQRVGKDHIAPGVLLEAIRGLEAVFITDPRRQRAVDMLQNMRIQISADDLTTRDSRFKLLDPSLRKEMDQRFQESLAICKKIVADLRVACDCPGDVVEFYMSADNDFHYRGLMNSERAKNKQSNEKNPFPTVENLFEFGTFESEKGIRAYLEERERAFPVPSPFPSTVRKLALDEPWLVAAAERSLFAFIARSFYDVGPQSTRVCYYRDSCPPEHEMLCASHNSTLLPRTMMPAISELFDKCRSGDVDDLERFCARNRVPIASMDRGGATPLTMALLSGKPEAVRKVMHLCAAQHRKKKKKTTKKHRGANPERIDNFKLMNEVEQDDEDGEDDENEEEEDEEGPELAADPKKTNEPDAVSSPPKPDVLLRLVASIHISSSLLQLEPIQLIQKQLDEFQTTVATKFGVTSCSVMTIPRLKVTPVQLAIAMGSIELLEVLLDEAKSLSLNLPHDLLLHNLVSTRFGNSFYLAIALDQVDMLKIMITKHGYAMRFEKLVDKLRLPAWKFDLYEVVAANEIEAKDKGSTKLERYTGLSSIFYGASKRAEQLKRNPRLWRLTRFPQPDSTLLHFASLYGAAKCAKFLSSDESLDAAKAAVSLPQFGAVRELFASVRDSAPKAFQVNFGSDVSLESDARVLKHFFLGDVSTPDTCGRLPIHFAVFKGKLRALLDGGVALPKELVAHWNRGTISLEDKIRFNSVSSTSLGEFHPGASPLSQAAYIGNTEACVLLMDKVGLSPAVPDEYFFGMNAFHTALLAKKWDTAEEIARRLKPSDLLQPSKNGITPLMTAARSGTLEGLQAAIAACEAASKEQLTSTVFDRDQEGRSALHVAATARFSETLRTVMDWASTAHHPEAIWAQEDFTMGQTPLDGAVGSVLAQELYASKSRSHGIRTTNAHSEYSEKVEDGRACVVILEKRTSAETHRTRAQFPQVRPAREKRLATIAGGFLGTAEEMEIREAKEDFSEVWGKNCHESGVDIFAMVRNKPGLTAIDLVIDGSLARLSAKFW